MNNSVCADQFIKKTVLLEDCVGALHEKRKLKSACLVRCWDKLWIFFISDFWRRLGFFLLLKDFFK